MTCDPSSGGSGIRLNAASARLSRMPYTSISCSTDAATAERLEFCFPDGVRRDHQRNAENGDDDIRRDIPRAKR